MNENVNDYNKEELKKWFTVDNKSGHKSTEKYLKKHYPELYQKIIDNSNNEYSFPQKIILFLENISEIPKCPVCGNSCKFLGSVNRGFSRFCSSTCCNKSEITINKKKITYSSDEFLAKKESIKKKQISTFMKNYGVDNPMKIKEIQEKIKQTNLEKYGVENVFSSETIKDKIKQTNLKKYGVKHLSHSKKYINSIRDKIKTTFKLKMIEIISNTLGIDKNNIDINNKEIIINNYCKHHKTFIILKNNYHSRLRYNANICTKCYPISEQSSINELEVKDYINYELKLNAIKNNINNKEIDIYLPDHKLGIEFDGLYWHSHKYKDKNYHLNKTESCENQGIQLLHIFEDEWANKKEIVKSIIKNKLGIYENIINYYEIKENINNELIKEFLNNNHIFGYIESDIKIGLFNNNELISLILFKKIGENKYEILRFCDKLDTLVTNSINNLINYFIKNYNPKLISVSIDRRYNNGNIYKQLGFKFIENTEPNYWYFKTSKLIKYHYSKITNSHKYFKIYDCGTSKFELKSE